MHVLKGKYKENVLKRKREEILIFPSLKIFCKSEKKKKKLSRDAIFYWYKKHALFFVVKSCICIYSQDKT